MHELFEHTADLGLRATSPDLPTLFAEMGQCLLSAIVETPHTVQQTDEVHIELVGTDREYLLVDWLKELLNRFETDRLLLAAFDIQLTAAGLTATARGERYDPARHALSHEVKAITYHALKVEQTPDGWRAEVIVDI